MGRLISSSRSSSEEKASARDRKDSEHTLEASQKEKKQGFDQSEAGNREESGNPSTSERPHGGTRAWLRVLGCFIILANTMGIQSSFGGFQSFYQQSFLSKYSSSEITWIGTVQVSLSAFGGIATGPLFDSGYDKFIVPIGCFLSVLAYMMLSLCENQQYYQVFLAQAVCAGLSGFFVFAPLVALTSLSFEKRRSLAVGITTSGFTFGAVIYPIVFRRLQPRIGFEWISRVVGFIALACFIVAYPLVYWKTDRPRSKIRKLVDWSAFKEAPYTLYCAAVFCMYTAYWPPYFFLVSFANKALGTSLNLAFYIFAISNAANTIARFTATFLADRFGILEVLTAASAISTAIAFCWSAVSTPAGLIVWSIFWGYFSGVMSACFAAVVPALSPSPSVVGTRLGMVNAIFAVGALVSAPIAGEIISIRKQESSPGGYLGMQMYVGALLAVATGLFVYPLVHLRRLRAKEAVADDDE